MYILILFIVILGSGLAILTVFVIKTFMQPRRIDAVGNLITQGKTNHAIRIVRGILAKEPRNLDAHYFLGLAYLADGKPELALMELKTVNPWTSLKSAKL